MDLFQEGPHRFDDALGIFDSLGLVGPGAGDMASSLPPGTPGARRLTRFHGGGDSQGARLFARFHVNLQRALGLAVVACMDIYHQKYQLVKAELGRRQGARGPHEHVCFACVCVCVCVADVYLTPALRMCVGCVEFLLCAMHVWDGVRNLCVGLAAILDHPASLSVFLFLL